MSFTPRAAVVCAVAVSCFSLSACLYDADEACPATLEMTEAGFCSCPAGTTLVRGEPPRCLSCGANETVENGACVCAAGFTRPAGGGACQASGLGESCDTATKACSSAMYPYCRAASGTEGYCTVMGCGAAQPCPQPWVCVPEGAVSYCRRPPVGQGKPCSSPADCSGTDATYCEASTLRVCLVEGCDRAQNDCTTGFTCCQVSATKTLCLPVAKCPTI